MNFKCILLALFTACQFNFVSAQEDDDLLLNLIPILAATSSNEEPIPPEWGIFNALCCPSSSATLTVTQGSTTQTSTRASCSVNAPNPSFRVSTAGNRDFASTLRSDTCPNLMLPFSLLLENNKRYVFQAELQNNMPAIAVFVQERTTARETLANNENVDPAKTMTKLQTILLNSDNSADKQEQWRQLE